MATITYTFRATVIIKVEANTKGAARKDAEIIRDQIRKELPTGATMTELLR